MPTDPDDKESAIINRHLADMLFELKKHGFKAEAAVGFVVFEGPENFNLATILDGMFPKGMTVERARVSLLNYAHNEICELLDKLEGDPTPEPGATRH